AIDRYAVGTEQEDLHIQEYAAPKSIDPRKAEQRLRELQQAAAQVFGVDAEHMSLKQRRRNPGKSQYEKLQANRPAPMITVREGDARFLVDLWSYLDSGVFLDHR